MSIPKSISLFLASVLVAIPTALTGIHLAKPKPLVHMNDELIELDEREEIPEPEEIRPQPAPKPKPKQESTESSSLSFPTSDLQHSPSQEGDDGSQSGGSQEEEKQQQDVVEEEEVGAEEESETPSEQKPEDSSEPEPEEEQDSGDKNDDQGDKEEEKKEPKEQELKDFLIQLIPLLIESSKKYKSGDSSLFDTYSVMSGLSDLNSTLESYKQLQEKAKAEAEKQEK